MIYEHKVQYYETDKMAVVHHSNYIRYMEEARVYYLEQAGAAFDTLETLGLVCPVTEVRCKYIAPVRFGDTVQVDVRLEEFRGARMKVRYEMRRKGGEVCCKGESMHCFIYEGKIIDLRRRFPDVYEKIVSAE